jgi:hypothetical protein
MRYYAFIAIFVFGVVGLTAFSAHIAAHEAHQAKCSKTASNALKADIQAMPDSDAKTKAMRELAMADEMMGKQDIKACEAHMHNAMEAIEE